MTEDQAQGWVGSPLDDYHLSPGHVWDSTFRGFRRISEEGRCSGPASSPEVGRRRGESRLRKGRFRGGAPGGGGRVRNMSEVLFESDSI